MNKYIKHYLLESEEDDDRLTDLETTLFNDAINSIFLGKDNSVILLSYDLPDDKELSQDISSDDDHGYHTANWLLSLNCLYIGKPELDSELKSENLRRFEIELDTDTGFDYSSWQDPGDYYTPGDAGIELSEFSTEVKIIFFNGKEVTNSYSLPTEFEKLISNYSPDDITSLIKKYNTQFI